MAFSLFLCWRALILALHHDVGGQMGNAHGGVGGVHMLAALAAGAIRVDAQFLGLISISMESSISGETKTMANEV